MKITHILLSTLLAALSCAPATAATITSAPGALRPITISTCAYDAGAICSLIWNGKQFLNDYDHGRQLQSALSLDGQGEYFNPTEAGASSLTDGINPHQSSSKLLYELASASGLTTQTQMAFWNPVGGKALSNHILTKRVQIGYAGMANVIEYRTEFAIPADEVHSSATFETLTAYMPPEFKLFYGADIRSGASMDVRWSTATVRYINDGPGEQPQPIIFSTADGLYAMGIYTPIPCGGGYGRWRFGDVVKWNTVCRTNNPAGTYRFTSYIAVGNLCEVLMALRNLQVLNAPHALIRA